MLHTHKLWCFALCVSLFFGLNAQCPNLVWSDEFDGNSLNTTNWNYELGDGCSLNICGWGNGELQSYQQDNAIVSNGTLKIEARQESVGESAYTSARLTTKNKQDFTYGRMEARIKLPEGNGTWPAFWMLPTDEVYGGWPQSGEIDIMEYVGSAPEKIFGTIHYGMPWPNNSFQGNEFILPDDGFYEDFHTFAIEWEDGTIRWFMDDILYSIKRPSNLGGLFWPFDQDFHFLLNVAIGGTLGGAVDNAIFPLQMEVDYVRVYDGNRPYISGNRFVDNAAVGEIYRVGNIETGATVNWTVPDGATIVSGQGGAAILVDWGQVSGDVTAEISLPCGTENLVIDVTVAPGFARTLSFENFDDDALAIYEFSNGTLSEVNNPDPNEVNQSAVVGEYVRDSESLFDVVVYNVDNLDLNGALFFNASQRINLDVWTSAPVGTQILVQLETLAADSDNYPTGRHSRYTANIAEQNSWHRLVFEPLDRPDQFANPTGIEKLVMLISPNIMNGNTYFYDNFDVYELSTTAVNRPIAPDFDIQVLPNPTSDDVYLNFELTTREDIAVLVYDLQGRLVKELPRQEMGVGAQQLRVSLADEPAGVYLLRLLAGGAEQTIKVVKE